MPEEAVLRRDAFLGGRVHVWQPARGYRAGMDAVLLAAACAARPGQRVLDLGCGAGTVSLCLAARVPGLRLLGVERCADMAELARRNAQEAAADMHVVNADATRPPPTLCAVGFDHVVLNPPYFPRTASTAGPVPQREGSMGEDTPLDDLLRAGLRRLVPGGWLTVIHRMERLPDLLAVLHVRGKTAAEAMPLLPRAGTSARLVLVRARKGGKFAFRLCPPVVLHVGEAHDGDRDSYTPQASSVLRDAAALVWPGRAGLSQLSTSVTNP